MCCRQGCKIVCSQWKTVWHFLINLTIYTYHTYQSHSQIFTQKEWNLCLSKDLHTNIYSSFIHNHQNWKQPKYPSVGVNEETNCGTSMKGVLLSNKKKWTIHSHSIRDECETHLFNGGSQIQKVPFLWNSGKDRTIGTEIRLVVASNWGLGRVTTKK